MAAIVTLTGEKMDDRIKHYKTRWCPRIQQGDICPRGATCAFAHDRSDFTNKTKRCDTMKSIHQNVLEFSGSQYCMLNHSSHANLTSYSSTAPQTSTFYNCNRMSETFDDFEPFEVHQSRILPAIELMTRHKDQKERKRECNNRPDDYPTTISESFQSNFNIEYDSYNHSNDDSNSSQECNSDINWYSGQFESHRKSNSIFSLTSSTKESLPYQRGMPNVPNDANHNDQYYDRRLGMPKHLEKFFDGLEDTESFNIYGHETTSSLGYGDYTEPSQFVGCRQTDYNSICDNLSNCQRRRKTRRGKRGGKNKQKAECKVKDTEFNHSRLRDIMKLVAILSKVPDTKRKEFLGYIEKLADYTFKDGQAFRFEIEPAAITAHMVMDSPLALGSHTPNKSRPRLYRDRMQNAIQSGS